MFPARKRFGQHWLTDDRVLSEIVNMLRPPYGDSILEIGPGRGALTERLAGVGVPIVAVEFDTDLISYLLEHFGVTGSVRIVNADILSFSPSDADLGSFSVVGNLPYNITSPILDRLIAWRPNLVQVVIMVQEEIGRRITGSPGGRDWSPLGILIQEEFDVSYAFTVPPEAFQPPPRVNSAIVRMTAREDALPVDFDFATLVRTAFRQRRKTLLNNLVGMPGWPTTGIVAEDLNRLALTRDIRAEQMPTATFRALYDCWRDRQESDA